MPVGSIGKAKVLYSFVEDIMEQFKLSMLTSQLFYSSMARGVKIN